MRHNKLKKTTACYIIFQETLEAGIPETLKKNLHLKREIFLKKRKKKNLNSLDRWS